MKTVIFTHHNADYIVQYGTSAQDNWDLIDKSSGNDIWFHVQDYPSSHVVIDMTNIKPKELPHEAILFCAKLCKDNSKAKSKEHANVIYTKIKNVVKSTDVGSVTTRNTVTIVIPS